MPSFHALNQASHTLDELKDALANCPFNSAAKIAAANPDAKTPSDLTQIAFETYAGKLASPLADDAKATPADQRKALNSVREQFRQHMLATFAQVLKSPAVAAAK